MWLLEPSAFACVRSLHEAAVNASEHHHQRLAALHAQERPGARLLAISGKVATITVEGLITDKPSLLAMLFGGGNPTWADILAAVEAAESSADVERVDFLIDSPGGTIAGMAPVLDRVASMSKPTRTLAGGLLASAAYGLASQTGEIIATDSAALIGSIGVVHGQYIDDNVVEVTSTGAEKKRIDMRTEEGKAAVREYLDDMHAEFVQRIASGRGVDVDTINAQFGQGNVMLPKRAIAAGMIDSVAQTKPATTPPAGGDRQESATMDVSELKSKHPETFAAVLKQGIEKERDRVSAHLIAAEAAGTAGLEIAAKAIKGGDDLTQTRTAEYMAAALRVKQQDDRQADEEDLQKEPKATSKGKGADDKVDAPDPQALKDAEDDEIANMVAAHMGVDLDAE